MRVEVAPLELERILGPGGILPIDRGGRDLALSAVTGRAGGLILLPRASVGLLGLLSLLSLVGPA